MLKCLYLSCSAGKHVGVKIFISFLTTKKKENEVCDDENFYAVHIDFIRLINYVPSKMAFKNQQV